MTLTGRSLIGFASGQDQTLTLNGINPATNEKLEPSYYSAGMDEVDRACELAADASAVFTQKSGKEKGAFLRKIAENIEGKIDALVERAGLETALPQGRLQGETGRTCGQLRLFAGLVEEGSWVQARIDHAAPERKPLPKPDVRSMLRPLGPVAIFGASNFPLAFSTAGGDTVSALAGGNPVVACAHYAHPGTCELIGQAIQDSIRQCDLPEGVFSLLYGAGHDVGKALAVHPRTKAVGFTGSLKGGRALMDIAAARSEPIPVFAEMGSINPMFILPGALKARGQEIAQGMQTSVTLGVGQFCTNPGLVLVEDNADAQTFAAKLAALLGDAPAGTMLTAGICSAYQQGTQALADSSEVKTLTPKKTEGTTVAGQATAVLFQTDASALLEQKILSREVFGPSTLLVTHTGRDQLLETARQLEGQLTATIHGTEEDLAEHQDLIDILATKVGRLIFNGYPTGVEVCHAMVHGGPYPASADGQSTSVGTCAIYRFVRPVCYQNFPEAALPEELKNVNPLGIWRLVDGQWTQG